MSRKIFFLDMDGTTLQDDKTISKENLDAIHWAVEQGHMVAVTTGRPVASAGKLIEKLQLNCPGGYLIAYNGAAAYDCGAQKLLYDDRLPMDYVKYLFSEAERCGIFIQTYTDTSVISTRDCPEIRYYGRESQMDVEIVKDIWNYLTGDPSKALLIDLNGREALAKFQADHMEWQKGKCISMFSCNEYLEYVPITATKGAAVHKLSQYLGIPLEDTVAIGDEENDLSMILEAGTGVAMCNGNDKVKAAADIITEHDNNHGGVAETIYRIAST